MESNTGNQDNEGEHVGDLHWPELMNLLMINKPPHEIAAHDVEGKELASVEQWHTFYYTYAKFKGFSVRKENVRRDKNNNEWQRYWVCSREGFRRDIWTNLVGRKKTAKSVTRCGCKADFKVTLERTTGMWIAASFQPDHNHELASPSEIQFLRSHREVPDTLLAQAKSMRRAGIKTSSILKYLAQETGGRERLPFQKTDLYNKLAADRREVGEETDCEGALGYLTCLAIRDGNFFCRFTVDEENRLDTIFWADGMSRRDYDIFGDILAFDTTYRKNAYNKPLMIMVGVNLHYRTCVYAVALLSDETAHTFTWILEQFLECMNNKHPHVVVTDGDHAMRTAIINVLPNSIHRLCSWHLETNAGNNVPHGEFKIQFAKLMYNFYEETEFERLWKKLIDDFGLQDSAWAATLHAKRKSWAETYLRGKFFGGMRTTQRCESMNSFMARFLDSKHLMRDFVCQIDAGIQDIRHTELEDNFISRHSSPQIPQGDPLTPYYEQVSSICTRNIYHLFEKEISGSNFYSITSTDYTGEFRTFQMSRFGFGEIRHHVRYWTNSIHLTCSCLLFETDGIPCRHIFAVMKHISLMHIPESLIKSRWRKDAKMCYNQNVAPSTVIPPDVIEVTRLGALTSDFNTLGLYACKYEDTFAEAKHEIVRLTDKFKNLCDQRQGNSSLHPTGFDEEVAANNNIIKDPIVVKTKGREKDNKKSKNTRQDSQPTPNHKRCRLCNELGHNRATCKNRSAQQPTKEDTQNSFRSQPFVPISTSQQSGSTIRLQDSSTPYVNQLYFTNLAGPNPNVPNASTNFTPDEATSYYQYDSSNAYHG